MSDDFRMPKIMLNTEIFLKDLHGTCDGVSWLLDLANT